MLGLDEQQLELDEVAELAHRHLGCDLAFIAEVTPHGLVLRALAGDASSFNAVLNQPLKMTTYSDRLLAGEISGVIQSARDDPRVADLPVTAAAEVGSYLGVPLRLSDGTVYGTFCCMSHEPDPELGERDLRFMALLAEQIVHKLDELRSRQALRKGILDLIETEDVTVAYQPIIDLRTDAVAGVEALARFPAPYARPDETFAAAEQFGLGLALERLVIRRALPVLEQLSPGQFLALNLTPGSLLSLARRAHARPEMSLSSLVVEITEHAAINHYTALRRELRGLRKRGLRIAVDDAGAGYASLRHVLELRPDIIKLDRSLIHGLARNRARALIVSAFVSLASDLNATLVAEGVELTPDLNAARKLGVHAAQGYLLDRPSTDPAALSDWLKRGPTQERTAP